MKTRENTKSKIKLFYWLFVPLVLDQLLKTILVKQDFFSLKFQIDYSWLVYVCNKGIAFGIEFNKFLIIFINFFIITLLLYGTERVGIRKGSKIASYLIIGAAISNLLDRLIYGCVVDYIDFQIWPVFNLADLTITLSVFYLLFHFKKRK
ncbi:MAG: signal peptidase II [Patescibacteria group bacterium]|nr:signal peptidase II [Patescibacteria group bacterium]